MRISHQLAFQVLYVGLMNSFETISLDQIDDTAKTGLYIGRQRFEFISNAIVEQLYDPSHQSTLLHFCNVRRGFRKRPMIQYGSRVEMKIRVRLEK